MSDATASVDLDSVLAQLESAASEDKLTDAAVANIRTWLTEPRYAEYANEVADHIVQGKWKELDDAFWTVIPFGTGGRRGRMYPIGCNVINDRTIGESAQGLADYIKQTHDGSSPLSCAIAYDTRHNSRHFAELCASIMVAAGFKVYFLDDYRATPEMSFLVRYKHCTCGIMVTASHNPPSDNAVKVYGASGGQLVPPHDTNVIKQVESVEQISRVPFDKALADGQVEMCKDEVDAAFINEVAAQAFDGPRDVKVIFSPLHGVGESAVAPVLKATGFSDVEIFEPHREPSGDFPNVPDHVSNPENPAVFDTIIERAKESGAELILATDPDCDRMGAAAPLTLNPGSEWATFTGNQLGALLTDYVLEMRRGHLTPEHYVVKTLVTTEMIRRISDSYGVRTEGNLQVGFKWIGDLMDKLGPEKFVFGSEESHGYLVGKYARDKDGAVACLLMSLLAAKLKAEGKSLHEKLDSLYWQHGYHVEHLVNIRMEGSDGMQRMLRLMAQFRDRPPKSLGGIEVTGIRDYQASKIIRPNGDVEPLDGPVGDMVILDLAQAGNYVAARPSGTEPKSKFYMFAYTPAELLADLDLTRQQMRERIAAFETDLRAYADQV
jgi:phosphomannomutase